MKSLALLLLAALTAAAEVKTLTLREAIELALKQNPDVILARLDQQKARYQVSIARDPFVPKVFAGSGAAYTYGYPNSIDGNAPAIVQVKTIMSLYNRPQSFQVAQANEALRATEIEVGRRQDEVVYRVAELFLLAELAARSLGNARRQVDSLARVKELVDTRVSDGRELAIESTKAKVASASAQQRVDTLALDLLNAETMLALVLGMSPEDRVKAAVEERSPLASNLSEGQAIEAALENSREIKRLESDLQVKTLEVKHYSAMRYPKIDLVAQYSLFSKYQFQDYFQKFQRNNAQIGASFEIPILVGRGPRAYVSQAETDQLKIRAEMNRTRSRIAADLRRAFMEMKKLEGARELARLELDLAREQLTLDLAQMDEGRAPLARVESSRAAENAKWLAYYEAQTLAERARLDVLRQTGTLQAALK
jgi:outer membrane protein TolC